MSQLLQQVRKLVPTVREVIQLGQILNLARESFEIGERREPSTLNMQRWEAYHKDPQIQKAKRDFFDYLNSMPYDDVVLIGSIMYIGRDEKDPDDYERRKQEFEEEGYYFDESEDGVYDSPQKKIFDYMKHIKRSKTPKDVVIGMMMEKAPLPNYLTRGLHILGF